MTASDHKLNPLAISKNLLHSLNEAHRLSGMTQHQVAPQAGITQEGLSSILRGVAFPRHETVVALVDVWGHDCGAIHASLQARTKQCRECGREYVDMHRRRLTAFCSPRCKNTNDARANGRKREATAGLAKRRLTMFQQAVAAHCRGCAPDGICWDPTCKLVPVSPFNAG